MATATLTKAVRALLADVENGGFTVDFAGKILVPIEGMKLIK